MKRLLVVLVLLMSTQAQADVIEFGVGETLDRYYSWDTGKAVNISYIDTDKKYPIEYTLGHVTGTKGSLGPLGKDQFYVSVGLRKYWGGVFIGGAIAAASETNQRLSSTLNFKSQVGYSYKSIVFKVEHISNGNTSGKNDGENIVTIGYRKEF